MSYKSINFDLSTKQLKLHYPKKNYRSAYSDIAKFLKTKGFEHRQYSGYVSVKEVSRAKALQVIRDLAKAHPWLGLCVESCMVTNADLGFAETKEEIAEKLDIPLSKLRYS